MIIQPNRDGKHQFKMGYYIKMDLLSLSKHLSEQELTSHMSLRTKRGRFSENFPILN